MRRALVRAAVRPSRAALTLARTPLACHRRFPGRRAVARGAWAPQVQDPKDDSFLLTLFLTEEDATRYLYMLLDEDIDSESTYAAAWYSGEEVVELLAEDIKLALVGEA